MKSKAQLIKAVVLFALSLRLCSTVFAQSPLATAYLETQNMGSAGLKTNFQLTLSAGASDSYTDEGYEAYYQGFVDTFDLTTNDVGRMLTINSTTGTNFGTLASILTNGESEDIGCFYWAGPTNSGVGEGFGEPITNLFPLPPGNNGIDFQGFQINSLSVLIDTLGFAYSPPSLPYTPSGFTSVAFAGQLFVNGDPLLLSTNVSETAEVGDSVAFSAFVASSGPLACEWYLNGSKLIGSATNYLVSGANLLQITNAQLTNSGLYTLVVSNNFGSLTSAPMILNVVPIVPQRPVPAVYLSSQSGSLWTMDYSDTIGPGAQWTRLAAETLTNTSQYYFDAAASLLGAGARLPGDGFGVSSVDWAGSVVADGAVAESGCVERLPIE